MSKLKRRLLAAAGGVVFMALGTAQAVTVSDTLLVDITVLEVCTMTVTSDVNFGSVTPGVTGTVQNNGEITYACSSTTVGNVEIDDGGTREMAGGSTTIVYTLGQDTYVDTGGGTTWGLIADGEALGISGAGVTTPVLLPVYGEVLAAAYADADTILHQQTVTVNLVY
jgi:spore coat protein U-like protein